jgi:hypothetical protein
VIQYFPRNSLVYGFFLVFICFLTPLNAEEIHYEFVESSRQIMRVGPNQNLDKLVEQIYADYKPLWPQIKQKIYEFNPGSFDRLTGQLIVGASLKMVTIKKIREIGEIVQTSNHSKPNPVNRLIQVGAIKGIKGNVIATDKNGKQYQLKQNSPVFEGDRIKTLKDSTVAIDMVDGAKMYLKTDSSIRITEYVLKSAFEKGSRSIIDLVKGGLRKITGAIAANPLSTYRFNTGVMTIGVRGTDYVAMLCKGNDCEHSAKSTSEDSRLHVTVLNGAITLEDGEGMQGGLAQGQYAVADMDKVAIVEDQKPVPGLLTEEESKIFQNVKPPEEEEGIWPWVIGGALFGLAL